MNSQLEKLRSGNIMQKAQCRVRRSCSKLGWLILFTIFLIPTTGHSSISIMPMEAKLQVSRPGARLTNDIEVYNSSDSPIQVVTTVKDWTMTASGQKQFHEPGTQPLSCANWIQINPIQFNLPPKKSMRVRYSIAPPVDMSQEHSAMIFFTSRIIPKSGDGRFGLSVQMRMGCKILVSPILKAPLQGKISDMELQTFVAPQTVAINATNENPKLLEAILLSKIKVAFENLNPVSVRLNATVGAYREDGQLVAKAEALPAKALAMSGTTRELWAQFDKPLPPGIYRFKVIIDYGAKELVSGELKAQIKVLAVALPQSDSIPQPTDKAEQAVSVQD